MRRNLTISFDEEFIGPLDEARGTISRGKFLELCAVDRRVAVSDELSERIVDATEALSRPLSA